MELFTSLRLGPMDFQVFHDYNRLADRGVTKPLTCQHCDTKLTLTLGEEDKPVLKCFGCGTTTYPGLKLYDQLRSVVKEFYV